MLGLTNTLLAESGITKEVYTDGYSVAFDGTGDYIDTGGSFQSVFRNSFTISLWVKVSDGQPSSATSLYGSIDETTGDAGQIDLFIHTDGKLKFYFQATAASAAYDIFVSDSVVFSNGANAWKHIVCVMTLNSGGNSSFIFYVDGAVEDSAPDTSSTITEAIHSNWTSNNALWIGGFNNSLSGLAKPFTGNINDFAIWNVALDANAVAEIYNSGDPTDLKTDTGNYDNSSNLVGYWKFEENTGTIAYDSAGNNNGTLSGDPQWDNDVP